MLYKPRFYCLLLHRNRIRENHPYSVWLRSSIMCYARFVLIAMIEFGVSNLWAFYLLFVCNIFNFCCRHVLTRFRMRFCWFGMATIRICFSLHCVLTGGLCFCYNLSCFDLFAMTALCARNLWFDLCWRTKIWFR